MESSGRPERRSERKRKRKETYSPDSKKDEKNVVKKSRNKSRANRPYDVLPNGEPFLCHLCKSPYVVNTVIKSSKKTGRSSHTPLPKVRIDKNTGREIMLCNACVQIYDRPPRRSTVKPICVPSDEEKKAYMADAENFVKMLKSKCDNQHVDRLYCPLSQKKLCGCLQKCIRSSGDLSMDIVHNCISLIKEAVELRKEKAYPERGKVIGLGNGHKKSKKYEQFVITKRQYLREDLHLCERATQKILLYSNNFLHKRLKTENRPCRIERTRGKAALGKLPEFHKMVDLHCCMDNCVMLALTHKRLLQDWRLRSQQGQAEARRVVAEMLTPAGALHTNCYSFISMVTGCCGATISSVYNQMIDTGGLREPPEHGMKRVWQEHYKRNKTLTEGSQSETSTTTEQQVSGVTRQTTHLSTTTNNVTSNINTLQDSTSRQNKLLWIQELAKSTLQQQLSQQLHDFVNKHKNKQILDGSTPQQQQQQQTSSTCILPTPVSISQQHYNPGPPAVPNQSSSIVYESQLANSNQELINQVQGHPQLGQGHNVNNQGQGHIHQIVLQPPTPQFGLNQPTSEKPLQYTFHIDLNQPNYVVTAEEQILPVIPIFKYQGEPQGHLTPSHGVNSSLQSISTIPQSSYITGPPQHNPNVGLASVVQNQEILPQHSVSVSQHNDVCYLGDSIETSTESQNLVPSVQEYQILTNNGMVVIQAPKHDTNTENNGSLMNVDTNTAAMETNLISRDTDANMAEKENINVAMETGIHVSEHSNIGIPENSERKSTNMTTVDNSVKVVADSVPAEPSRKKYNTIINQLRSVQSINTINRSSEVNGSDVSTSAYGHQSTVVPVRENVSKSTNHANVSSYGVELPVSEVIHSDVVHTNNAGQILTPVNYVPALPANTELNKDLPSQIQISFRSCSSTGEPIGLSQQIVVPQNGVVTLPLLSVPCSDPVTQTNASCEIIHQQIVPKSSASSSEQIHVVTSDYQKDKMYTNSKVDEDNIVEKQETQSVKVKVVRSRNMSGMSGRKSRNSSGSSEKSKRMMDHVGGDSHLDVKTDHYIEGQGHFMSKLDKIRHRQASGNSEHDDRSRKSSGNSMISDSSSHVSGFTLSNLASPNIFHDKDKGIFFMQSLEFNEIDSGHVAEFIQAVESDNVGNITYKHNIDDTSTLLHDSTVIENN
ncbi:hypothetical protein ACF0H5_021891 [Mactra antiquata]